MRPRLLLTTALVVPALIACASKDGGSAAKNDTIAQKPVDVIHAAAENTAKAGSARMAMTVEGSGVSMTASGVTATDKILASMTMTMDAGGQQVEVEMRMIDMIMYMKMPGLPGGKPWAKLDLEALSTRADIDIAALAQLRQNDPKQALAYMKGMSGDVKEVGKEDVRGAATTKYQGTLDMSVAAKAQTDARVREAIESLVKQTGAARIPTTVWIDAEGRMRKMVQTVDVSQGAMGGAGGPMTTTIEMYDFGVAVDVKAPPENEVGDAGALFGSS